MADTLSLVNTSYPSPSVRVLAFNRPSKRNALSQTLIDEFLVELRTASKDKTVKVIVVTGTRSFFSGTLPLSPFSFLIPLCQTMGLLTIVAGADIKEISVLDAEDARRIRYLSDLCDGMKAVRKPIIAAVEGMAVGLNKIFLYRVAPW